MKKLLSVAIASLFVVCGLISHAQTNANSIAVSVVYDGSGSMADTVLGENKAQTAKYIIANKAVSSVIRQMATFSQKKNVNIQVGLVYFTEGSIRQAIPLANLTTESSALFFDWSRKFNQPSGGTPLGLAIQEAQKQLNQSQSTRKHILVITDGASNMGISPEKALREIRDKSNPISVYFVAFDVTANLFKPVKEEGASVVSASDEVQLNTEINHILGQKILLESE